METMRVLARGSLLVLDLEFAQATGQRKYVGRKAVAAWKLDELPAGCPRHEAHNLFLEPGEKPIPHYAFPMVEAVVELPFRREYRDEVQGGALWPADQATAAMCGVPFDPTFGGEHPALTVAAPKPRKAE
jgi:hypothetical protein